MATILIVDDEQRICRFVARALEADGYTVDTSASGPEAVRLCRERDYSLVILDLLLPGLDGYEVLRRVLVADADQRVMVVSAVSEVSSRVRCLRMGATDYLDKPFAIAELVERVRRRVDDRQPATEPRWLVAGGLRLDLQRRALQVNERDIALSQREFVLLGHLMRHANEVCTRMELLSDVWGYSFDPGSNVVDVCVRRLRSKLQSEKIETIRNVGYSFIAS